MISREARMNHPLRSLSLIPLVLLAACNSGTAPVAQPSAAPQAIATTRQIMLGITAPASDVVFQVGVKEPETDAEWEKIQASALSLAESAQLLMTGPRAVDQQEWRKHVEDLITTSKAAAVAAGEKDVDKVLDVGNRIYEVCDGCHRKYMAARQGEDADEPAPQ
jgi:cytochrome c556